MNFLLAYTEQFNTSLLSFIDPMVNTLDAPAKYLLENGGKRIRPAMVLIANEMYDGQKEEALNLAIALELFHNFTLMHDDIMDNASLRRGKDTVHKKWNLSQAILSGDALLIRSYTQLGKLKTEYYKELQSKFNKMAFEVCQGQQMDIDFEVNDKVTLEEYLEMIKLKTGVLIGACLEMSGMLACAPVPDWQKLNEIGNSLGLAFQIQDDYLDVFGDTKVGKQKGGDILVNKKTYLMIQALSTASETQMAKFIKVQNEQDPHKKIEETIILMEELNIGKLTGETVKGFYQQARKSIGELSPESIKLTPLLNLVDLLENREL